MKIALLALLAIPISGYAMNIHYVDASFGRCGIPSQCHGARVESYLHALTALGRDTMQSFCKPGAFSVDLRDQAISAADAWRSTGLSDAGPDYLVFGIASDVLAGDFESPLVSLTEVVNHYAAISPKTQVWAIGYPPIGAEQLNNPFLSSRINPAEYEQFRVRYYEHALALGVKIIQNAYYKWMPSNDPHPLIPGGDYHLTESSALNAAMRIYYAIRTQ